jgi:spermidine/putrescine transport system ATP-binding protein
MNTAAIPHSPFAVSLRGITKSYGSTRVLGPVSLEIGKGEFFSLLGPSGCGKTTLLRIIAGLEECDDGSVWLGSQDVTRVPPHKRPVNTVFQSYALFPHLTVRDNVSFGLRMKGTPLDETEKRVTAALELVHVVDFAKRYPNELSGGQQQRVALARAVVNEPSVVLLDEPLAALDRNLRQDLQTELRELQRRLGITFIFVTHDQDEAFALSDRIAVFNKGLLEQLGTAQELYQTPSTPFSSSFVGDTNALDGRLVEVSEGKALVDTILGQVQASVVTSGLVAGSTVHVLFRPEDLVLQSGANEFSAQVEFTRFGGPHTTIRLKVGSGALDALVRSSEVAHLVPGQSVTCSIRPEAITVRSGG